MISKLELYKVTCDQCGKPEYGSGSWRCRQEVKRSMKCLGWVNSNKYKKHFCCDQCYRDFVDFGRSEAPPK